MTASDPRVGEIQARRQTLEQRLWAKVDKRGPDECWPWMASKDAGGYGLIGAWGSTRRAHRVAYTLEVGPIPEGLHLDHTCHGRSDCRAGRDCPHRGCVNPSHLEPVTNAVNAERGNGALFQTSKTHCPRGHEYSLENTRLRLVRGKYIGRNCRTCDRSRAKVNGVFVYKDALRAAVAAANGGGERG